MKEHGCVKQDEFVKVRWVLIDGKRYALKPDIFRLFDIADSGKAYTEVICTRRSEVVKGDLRGEFGSCSHNVLCLNEDIVRAISVYSTLKDKEQRLLWVCKEVFKNTLPLKIGKPPEGFKISPLFVETKSKRVNIVLRPSVYDAAIAKAELEGVSFNEFVNRALEREIPEGKVPVVKDSEPIFDRLKSFEETIRPAVQNMINGMVNNVMETCMKECMDGIESQTSKGIGVSVAALNDKETENAQKLSGRKLLKSEIDKMANIVFGVKDECRYQKANNMFVSEYNKTFDVDLWKLKTKCESAAGIKIESIPAFLETMGWINNALLVANKLLEKYGITTNEEAAV